MQCPIENTTTQAHKNKAHGPAWQPPVDNSNVLVRWDVRFSCRSDIKLARWNLR
jgi:hypothetical protein